MPMSASRTSSVATSSTCPPVSSRSKVSFPCAAEIALSRTARSTGSNMMNPQATRSLALDIGRLHDRGELFDFRRQELCKFRRSAANHAQVDLFEFGARFRFAQRRGQCAVDAIDN